MTHLSILFGFTFGLHLGHDGLALGLGAYIKSSKPVFFLFGIDSVWKYLGAGFKAPLSPLDIQVDYPRDSA